MFPQLALIVLALLRLGGAQECGGFVGFLTLTQDQLKKEIRAEVAAALAHGGRVSEIPQTENNSSGLCRAVVSDVEKGINATVEQAVSSAMEVAITNISREVRDAAVSSAIDAALDRAVANLSATVEQLISPLVSQLSLLRQPGKTPSHPATSCKEILDLNPTSPSGYYWISDSDDSAVHVYCDMTKTCGGVTGGWMEIAKIDMSDTTNVCPEGLKTLSSPMRLCSINSDGPACSSATFNVHGVNYQQVCGKIIGYQQKTPDGFRPYHGHRQRTIDNGFVDGVVLTHGHGPRKHIWTFAAALEELRRNCPCIYVSGVKADAVPPYVGSDYFCDTASEDPYQFRFYPDDPLWDGEGCGPQNTCCSFNNPPWFMKDLSSSTTDDIEMRLCADSGRNDEDITVEIIELYVR